MKYLLTLVFVFSLTGLSYSAEPDFNIIGSKKKTISIPVLVGNDKVKAKVKTPRPSGEGWQWSEQEGLWWKWGVDNPATTSPPAYNLNCGPNGCYIRN